MKRKIKQLATTLYESCHTDAAFERAWSLYPDYNEGAEDTDAAVEYIFRDLQLRFPNALSDEDREALSDELKSMIHAGLT